MLSVGIVGLPNVGKSSLFNALATAEANVSNYPFTTIDSNVGMVAVPDPRLAELAALLAPEKTTPAFIEFIDIAGLVEGASRGEGLGNQFLGAIRQVDAIAHVLRFFEESEVAHVFAGVDPLRDAEVVETELLLADLELMARAREKQAKVWKTDPKGHREEEERWQTYRQYLENGVPLRALELDPFRRQETKRLGLLTGKPLLYVANLTEGVDEAAYEETWERLKHRETSGRAWTAEVVPISAKIEAELGRLEPAERAEFVEALGLETSGLERLVERAFDHLDLIRFYTVVKRKLQAWEVPRGTLAPQAAGEIHSDMEHGFVRAKVVSFAELQDYGSLQELHRRGRERTEGKEYAIQDGDVVEFLFTS